jgi:hypothetical protein
LVFPSDRKDLYLFYKNICSERQGFVEKVQINPATTGEDWFLSGHYAGTDYAP